MKNTYTVTGMTCSGCQQSVTNKLLAVNGVAAVQVHLEDGTTQIESKDNIPLEVFQKALPQKYTISKAEVHTVQQPIKDSKLKQLRPLLLIFAYLIVAAILLNYTDWNTSNFMLDFMGLFYIVFSFFKLLDLKGFPTSFAMYDPLAKRLPVYAWIYPFIELTLGLLFLMRIEVTIALWVTLCILGMNTFGVIQTLLIKKTIRCACLGTALNLPMTEATLVENTVMIGMAMYMVIKMGVV